MFCFVTKLYGFFGRYGHENIAFGNKEPLVLRIIGYPNGAGACAKVHRNSSQESKHHHVFHGQLLFLNFSTNLDYNNTTITFQIATN